MVPHLYMSTIIIAIMMKTNPLLLRIHLLYYSYDYPLEEFKVFFTLRHPH